MTNGTSSYSYPESTFIIRKESTGGVRYDLIQNNGKELLTNIYTTVGYSQDKFEYVLAAINENGTITKSGNISYTGTCSVNGEKDIHLPLSVIKKSNYRKKRFLESINLSHLII